MVSYVACRPDGDFRRGRPECTTVDRRSAQAIVRPRERTACVGRIRRLSVSIRVGRHADRLKLRARRSARSTLVSGKVVSEGSGKAGRSAHRRIEGTYAWSPAPG